MAQISPLSALGLALFLTLVLKTGSEAPDSARNANSLIAADAAFHIGLLVGVDDDVG